MAQGCLSLELSRRPACGSSGTRQELLDLGLARYWRNCTNHALYIDGTDLYPGFELDEFCSWFIALDGYLRETSDWRFVNEQVAKASEDFY